MVNWIVKLKFMDTKLLDTISFKEYIYEMYVGKYKITLPKKISKWYVHSIHTIVVAA